MTDELSRGFADAIDQCLARGMTPPLVVCAATSDGNVIAMRITPGQQDKILAQHVESSGWQLPINIMVVDRTGEVGRVTIGSSGTSWINGGPVTPVTGSE